MLEAENLKIALEHYEGHPVPALLLAHQLMAIKQCLERGKKGIPDAIDGLDLAIEHGDSAATPCASAGFSTRVAEKKRTSTVKHAVSAAIEGRRFMIVVPIECFIGLCVI